MDREKFCLRWNDFETNISGAFRELRNDKDFFDVTLACDDDQQIQAHKVIIAACSPFFRNILRRNHHQHPLLYMKGVKYIDLQAVLNFMYHGEVNVAQEELNSFLAVAEDLKVKGLTQTQETQATNQQFLKQSNTCNQERKYLQNQNQSPPPPISKPTQKPEERKFPRPRPPVHLPATIHNNDSEDIEEVVPIKSEPRDLPSHGATQKAQIQDTTLVNYQEDGGYGDYEDFQEDVYSGTDNSSHYNINSLNSTDSSKGIVPGSQDHMSSLHDYISKSEQTSSWQCTICGKECTQKVNLIKHVETVHFPDSFTHECKYCGETFNTKNKLYHHVRKHKNF